MVEAFLAEGTRHVFALMGDGNMLWLSRMAEQQDVRIIHARHQGSAVMMAAAFADTSGTPGIATVTCGPGITQIASSLAIAVRRQSSVVVFAGDTPTNAPHHLQTFDPAPFAASLGVPLVRLSNPRLAHQAVGRSFDLARSQNTPVLLTAPMDLQEADVIFDGHYRGAQQARSLARRLPDDREAELAADILRHAERPAIIVGRGALLSEAIGAVARLAELLGAPIATTLLAKDAMDRHPLALGLVGYFSTDSTRRVFGEADVVVAIGASLGYFSNLGGGYVPPGDPASSGPSARGLP